VNLLENSGRGKKSKMRLIGPLLIMIQQPLNPEGLGLRVIPPGTGFGTDSSGVGMLDLVTGDGPGTLDNLAADNVKYLRTEVQRLESEINRDHSANKLTRGLLVSFFLLLAIFVAATVTIRRGDTGEENASRTCPLSFLIPAFGKQDQPESERKPKKPINAEPDDSPIDWGRVITSNQYKSILDPKSVPINNLLSTPPPTFIRRDGQSGTVTPASNLQSLIEEFRSIRKEYITISEQ
jgi:hypothetical protein